MIWMLLAIETAAAAADPVAEPASIVTSNLGCARFTVLTPNLVRIERSATQFDDRATFTVINRKLRVPQFTVERKHSTYLVITTSALRLTHNATGRSCGGLFTPGELEVELLVEPFSKWKPELGHASPATGRERSSVARIMPEPSNLNGTMNLGPSFAGGLDCYSNPPDCEKSYRQIIGKGLLSRSGFALVNDTNSTRMASGHVQREQGNAFDMPWFDPNSTREANHIVAEDLYLLVSGINYTDALRDWTAVSGGPALPPLAALGVWYSRYFPYGQADLPAQSFERDVVQQYAAHGLPLSVGVLDVPWHAIDYPVSDLGPDKNGSWPYPNVPGTADPCCSCNGWDGFTFNSTLFPDPGAFFKKMRSKYGLKMILSVHMQNGIDHCQDQYARMAGAMGFSPQQIRRNLTVQCEMDKRSYVQAFYEQILTVPPIVGTADWWWLDYPGGASGVSGWEQQEPASVWWSNHVFGEYARAQGKRPVMLARYGGMGAQREGIGFSGDTFQSFGTLEWEVEMTPTASNALFGWWSHDIGGNHNGGTTSYTNHTMHHHGPYPGDETPTNATGSEMLLRWIQFGAFSPIFRTHCEPTCDRYVWEYARDGHFRYMRAAMRVRDALVPYIYTAGYDAAASGVSLLRPMYYRWGRHEESYAHPYQYMFGAAILAAPIATPVDNATGMAQKAVWLPPLANGSAWLKFTDGSPAEADGDRIGSQKQWAVGDIPLFVEPGAVIPTRTYSPLQAKGTEEQMLHSESFVDPLVWLAWEGAGAGSLYEDTGDGLEYLTGQPSSSARTDAHIGVNRSDSSQNSRGGCVVNFIILPTVGWFSGQKATRHHHLQLRKGHDQAPTFVLVNSAAVPRLVAPVHAEDRGWYISTASADGATQLTEPAGSLVVQAGEAGIRTQIAIAIGFDKCI